LVRTSSKRTALVALLVATVTASSAGAQSWSVDPALSVRSNEALTVDAVGLRSEPSSTVTGAFSLSVPAGSRVMAAVLYTSVQYRTDMMQPANLPGAVALDGVGVIGSMPIPFAGRLPGDLCSPNGCRATIRTDVTLLVQDAIARRAGALPSLSIPISERGDSPAVPLGGSTGEVFSYLGHTLVVRYRNEAIMARARQLGVWWGVSDERSQRLLIGGTLPAELARCSMAGATPERDERAAISATIVSQENGCGESAYLQFSRGASMSSVSQVGGADDAQPSFAVPTCGAVGRTPDVRDLITAGSFGGSTGVATSDSALLTGAPVGLDGDVLLTVPAPPRLSDELVVSEFVPTDVILSTSTPYRLPKALTVLVMQYPFVGADSDGDGFTDVEEGICNRVNTDRPSDRREDWDDTDSDNDCVLDSMESAASRTIPATFFESDSVCVRGGGTTVFCDRINGACVSCSISCAGNALGSVCRRVGTGALACGCSADSECPSGSTCDLSTKQCSAVARDAGTDAGDAMADSGVSSDGAASDGAAFMDVAVSDATVNDATINDSAINDSAINDTTNSDATNNDATVNDATVTDADKPPTFTGGACACRAGAATGAGADGAVALAALAALAALGARRRRQR
jgi:MYXO-CTERM domain-containing protein